MRYESGRCTNPAVGDLPLCGPCLGVVLSEADPGRRRSLAGSARLPEALVVRLAGDPDAGVRARLAIRDDPATRSMAHFADPAYETSPAVWRAVAASRSGAAHATALVATGDRLTLLVLATNPATPPDVLDRLADHPDPAIRATVAATRTGQPPDDAVIAEVLGARAIPARPLAEAPTGTRPPGPPTGSPASPQADAPVPGREPASHRGLVIGFVVALVLLVGVVAFLGFGGGSGDEAAPTTSGAPTSAGSRNDAGQATTLDGRAPTTTSAPSDPAGPGAQALVLDLTMTAQRAQRFCGTAAITITFDGPTAHVVVTDDAGRELWRGPWDTGATKRVDLFAPSRTLHAQVTTTADPDTFRPSGSVQGTFC